MLFLHYAKKYDDVRKFYDDKLTRAYYTFKIRCKSAWYTAFYYVSNMRKDTHM